METVVEAPGFVASEVVEAALGRALALALPSRREGYGLVVLEALSRGTPVVLVSGDDNAATEFILEGKTGFLAATADARHLAEMIALVAERGTELRTSALAWFAENKTRLSLQASLEVVRGAYGPRL
jgi:glycosyltransferase involved in cell wall biosynthesis